MCMYPCVPVPVPVPVAWSLALSLTLSVSYPCLFVASVSVVVGVPVSKCVMWQCCCNWACIGWFGISASGRVVPGRASGATIVVF